MWECENDFTLNKFSNYLIFKFPHSTIFPSFAPMHIKKQVHISSNDFARLTLHLVYQKKLVKFTILLGILSFAQLLTSYFLENPIDILNKISIIGVMIATGLPTLTWMGSKMNYNNNQNALSNITYEFSQQGIRMTGSDFQSSNTWKEIYGASVNKRWFVIWRNTQVANPIPTELFSDEELQQLRAVFKKQGVKVW